MSRHDERLSWWYCPCADCRARRADYHRERRATLRRIRPTPSHQVDAAPVRAHILMLGNAQSRIAEASGVGRRVVHDIAAGRVRQTRRKNADAILAVRPADLRPPGRVPGVGTAALIAWMRHQGVTWQAIADGCGLSQMTVRGVADGARCMHSTAAAIRAFAERLAERNVA